MGLNYDDKEFIGQKMTDLTNYVINEHNSLRRNQDDTEKDRKTIRDLQFEVQDLKTKLQSADHERNVTEKNRLAEERQELEQEKKEFAKKKRVEYDKGYADAYTDIVNKMGAKPPTY